MNNIFALGRHITVELSGCDASIIADSKAVETALLEAAEASGAHIIESSFHYFAPQGVSGFVIISESHFSIHTWPEYDYAAVDVFTCGDTISPYAGIDRLKRLLHAQEAQISADMWRGAGYHRIGRSGETLHRFPALRDLLFDRPFRMRKYGRRRVGTLSCRSGVRDALPDGKCGTEDVRSWQYDRSFRIQYGFVHRDPP